MYLANLKIDSHGQKYLVHIYTLTQPAKYLQVFGIFWLVSFANIFRPIKAIELKSLNCISAKFTEPKTAENSPCLNLNLEKNFRRNLNLYLYSLLHNLNHLNSLSCIKQAYHKWIAFACNGKLYLTSLFSTFFFFSSVNLDEMAKVGSVCDFFFLLLLLPRVKNIRVVNMAWKIAVSMFWKFVRESMPCHLLLR